MKRQMLCFVFCLIIASLAKIKAIEVIYGHEDESKNLVDNWSFEQSTDGWDMTGVAGTRVSGAHLGSYSLEVDRSAHGNSASAGPVYTAEDLKASTNYYISMFMKFTDQPSTGNWITATMYANGNKCGYLRYQKPSDKWWQLGGYLITGDAISDWDITVQVSPGDYVYRMDSVAVTEIEDNPNLDSDLNTRIDNVRKRDVHIGGTLNSNIDLSQTTIVVNMTRHAFKFGTAIKASKFLKTTEKETNYRNFVLKYMNSITIENQMKWKATEKVQGTNKFTRLNNVLDYANRTDVKLWVRGHAIVWSVMSKNPNWLAGKSGLELENLLMKRVREFMEEFRGRLYEIDVCNEHLQKDELEVRTGNFTIVEDMFRYAHELDPDAKLCFNDYLTLKNGGWATSRQANMAKEFLDNGVPVHCIGLQSHLHSVPADPALLEHRLKILSQAGLNLSVTEASVHSDDVDLRAASLVTAYKVYFSHPNVTGITAWGFSDQFNPFADDYHWTNYANMTRNAAGDGFHDLMTAWQTHETFQPSSAEVSHDFRAFMGNYTLQVIENGQTVHSKEFILGDDTTVDITF